MRERDAALLGALGWWAFDIAVLAACFKAFGVDAGLTVAVVLSYRAFAYWLPMIPAAFAYLRLARTVASWEAAG